MDALVCGGRVATTTALSKSQILTPRRIEKHQHPLFLSSLSSSSDLASRVKNGIASVVAAATASDGSRNPSTSSSSTGSSTYLTQVSHQAPYRLIPLRSSAVQQAGAQICYLSNYGGGLLPGDRLHLNVRVEPNAKLGLLTQGSNRIYRQSTATTNIPQKTDDAESSATTTTTQSRTEIQVDAGGLLIVAPDPVTPFQSCRYAQEQVIQAHANASLGVIDWFSAGRVTNGEIWQHEFLRNATSFSLLNNDNTTEASTSKPIFVDAVRFDPEHLLMLGSKTTTTTTVASSSSASTFPPTSSFACRAVATLTLYGPQVTAVIDRCRLLQEWSMRPFTLTRQRTLSPIESHSPPVTDTTVTSHDRDLYYDILNRLGLSGRFLTSVSEVSIPRNRGYHVYVARYAATNNEDLYRLFHYVLQPLADALGFELYRDRIRSTQSSTTGSSPTNESLSTTPSLSSPTPDASIVTSRKATAFQNEESLWSMLILADSALPVGSFAHSNGLEVASQLQLLQLSSIRAAEGGEGRRRSSTTDLSSSASSSTATACQSYVHMATQSTMELASPVIHAVFRMLNDNDNKNYMNITHDWYALDQWLHLRLVSNPPACRASLDQGRNFLRVASQWKKEVGLSGNHASDLLTRIHNFMIQEAASNQEDSWTMGHLVPILAITAKLHGLSANQACQLFGYCVSRDLVSAAVRMNLLGPLASVSVLSHSHRAVQAGINTGSYNNAATLSLNDIMVNSSCAPILDLIQPSHDLLATRLFRT